MASNFGFEAYNLETGREPFVFISYKSEDFQRVAVYARYLHDNGINVWYDDGLHAGTDWESYLMSVIERENCKAVLLFVSSKVASSTVIPLETTQARKSGKPTVAIYLESGLDLGVLLNKAIKVYVEQRQSVNAYLGDEESVCRQVLEAAQMAMENADSGSAAVAAHLDEKWKTAQFFMMNATRSRSEEDVAKARAILVPMTEQHPTDYRGWLGLAMCECLPRVTSLDSAPERLRNCSRYYSYVVSAGADDAASEDYTRVKNMLWDNILDLLHGALSVCTDSAACKKLREQVAALDNRFGHTGGWIKQSYDKLVQALDERIPMFESSEKETARELAINQTAENCQWNIISKTEVELQLAPTGCIDIIIPGEIKGRRVTSIGIEAFRNCTSLESVVIPDSVRRIKESAFYGCENLRSVTIPAGVAAIENHTFAGCRKLVQITLPESITSIGENAFLDCQSLESIDIPAGARKIGKGAFSGCSSLSGVTLPENLTAIEENSFANCQDLGSITLPAGVKTVGKGAFSGCSSLSELISAATETAEQRKQRKHRQKLWLIPAIALIPVLIAAVFFLAMTFLLIISPETGTVNVGGTSFWIYVCLTVWSILATLIGLFFMNAAGKTNKQKLLLIPAVVILLGLMIFMVCTEKLPFFEQLGISVSPAAILIIPFLILAFRRKKSRAAGVQQTIGSSAFAGCQQLGRAIIPEGVAYIDEDAFAGCQSLRYVFVPNSLERIARGAFRECSNVTFVGDNRCARKFAKKNGLKFRAE